MTMLKIHTVVIRVAFSLLLYLTLTGCGTTQPSHFYMLSSIEDDSTNVPFSQHSADVHIGLGPVSLPKYLDRPSIITRSASSEVIVNEIHRWIEPLENNFMQVLARNLDTLLKKATITTFPWRGSAPIDYKVIVNVSRFDADVDNRVVLSAHWVIRRKSDEQVLHSKNSFLEDKAENSTYATLVMMQSALTEKLSYEIANKFKEIMVQDSRGALKKIKHNIL